MTAKLRASGPQILVAAVMGIALLMGGCDKNNSGTIDPRSNPPQSSAFLVSPASVMIDTVTPSAGVYHVATTVSAHVIDPDGPGDISNVSALAVTSSGDQIATATLHDDGVAPDAIANDGIFTGMIILPLARTDVGQYQIVFSSVNVKGIVGTNGLQTFTVFNHPPPPWLYGLVAPDTVTLHGLDTSVIHISVAVGDSEGIGNVADVIMYIPEGNSPTTAIHLLDDGLLTVSGDSVAGDGRYSRNLRVWDTGSTKKLYSLRLRAIDRSGDTSATLVHYLLIQ